ncbi:MAG: Fic family protein [Methanothrix sp.]|nr:Fic family protein [Methanothrix sp.]
MTSPIWSPRFTLTPAISRSLTKIEMARVLVDTVILPLEGYAVLRGRARVRASRSSTFIDGNRLTLEQAHAVIADETAKIVGLEKDVAEVRNYSKALQKAEEWAKMSLPLTETLISRFHRLAMTGKSSRPTHLRKKKSAVKNSATGDLVYLPPRPEDLPELIAALEIWTEDARSSEIAVPVIAGLVHYQLATLHPFNEGNGRTARLCADFILMRDGYSLSGLIMPEEQYREDIDSYYQALNVNGKLIVNVNGKLIDYYEGRAEADLTSWLEYYLASMVQSCEISINEMAAHFASTPAKSRRKRKGLKP